MKKLTVILVLLIAFIGVTNAQPYGGKLKTSKKIEIANEQYNLGDYYNALDWYNKALEAKPDDVYVMGRVAEVYLKLRDLKSAEEWFAKTVENDKTAIFPNAAFQYGRILKMNGNLDKAKSILKNFISDSDDMTLKTLAAAELNGIALAKEITQNSDMTVADAGDGINSPYTDFSPVYANDNEMYYGAMVADAVVVMDGSNTNYHAKIYKSTNTDGTWSDGVALGDNINRAGVHNGNVSFSKDGNTIYFTRSELTSNKINSSSLYKSERTGDGWGAAQLVEGLEGQIIRHPAVGEAYGQDVLFFVSDMAGGQGGTDIYYAPIQDGKLGPAVNLGSNINTVGDELTPFYNDGKLYFSSTGHPGIGGLDVFYSTWNGSWTAPVNAGKGINSSYDDIYYSTDKSGNNGFVVSNRPSSRSLKSKTCCDDIYTVHIKQVVLDLDALAFNSKTNKPLSGVEVQLIEMTKGSEGVTETLMTSPSKANFTLKRGMAYKVIAKKAGFDDAVVTFNTVGMNDSQTITKNMNLHPIIPPKAVYEEVVVYDTIRSQTPMRLNNILYDFGKSTIRPESESDLQVILGYMNSYPDMVIELAAHTDNIGRESANQRLSQKRAESARQWLVAKGIAPNRVQAVGYGESKPIAENKNADGSDNPEGRQLNRRTEFKIISGPQYIINKKISKRVIKRLKK